MLTHCDHCNGLLHNTPFISLRRGRYYMTCSDTCKTRLEADFDRESMAQRCLALGTAAFNGAD